MKTKIEAGELSELEARYTPPLCPGCGQPITFAGLDGGGMGLSVVLEHAGEDRCVWYERNPKRALELVLESYANVLRDVSREVGDVDDAAWPPGWPARRDH